MLTRATRPGASDSRGSAEDDWEQANELEGAPWIEMEGGGKGPGPVQRLRRGVKKGVERVRPNLGIASELSFLGLSAAVGFLTGGSVTIFKIAINFLKNYLYGDFVGNFPVSISQGVVALVPLLGAFSVVVLKRWAVKDKDFGPGLSGCIEEVDKQTPFSLNRAIAKAAAAVMTLGTGNSLGPEGPAVELGVGSSRWVAQWTSLSVEKQRSLLGAGAAAGVAAGFNAPIAGVFFALEIVRDSFGSSQFISKSGIAATLLCAAVSALTARLGLHEDYALTPAPYHLESPLVELPFYLGLGFLSGLVAATFRFFMAKSGEVFSGQTPGFKWMADLPWWGKPLIGAATTGIVGLFYPQILFFGYDTLDNLLANTGRYQPLTLLSLCFWKALVTSVCLGSGLVGGTFAPSLFLGATAGAAYQKLLVQVVAIARSAATPSLVHLGTQLHPLMEVMGWSGTGDLSGLLRVAEAPAYAMVGAASVLAAVYRAPLTGSLLLFELTEDYDIILPLMASAGVGSLLVELVQAAQQSSSVSSMAAAAAAVADARIAEMPLEMGNPVQKKAELLLMSMPVQDALVSKVLAVTEQTPVTVAVDALHRAKAEFMVVVECSELADGVTALSGDAMALRRDLKLLGVVSLRDVITHVDLRAAAPLQLPPQQQPVLGPGGPLAADSLPVNGYSAGEMPAAAVAVIAAAAAAGQTIASCYRRECFTVGPMASLAEARSVMNAKGVRYLPVIVGAPVADDSWESDGDCFDSSGAATAAAAAAEQKSVVCIGVVSLESLRVALRLRETEQAVMAGAVATSAAATVGGGGAGSLAVAAAAADTGG